MLTFISIKKKQLIAWITCFVLSNNVKIHSKNVYCEFQFNNLY